MKIHLVGLPRSGSTNISKWLECQFEPLALTYKEFYNEPFNNILMATHGINDVAKTMTYRANYICAASEWIVKSHIRHLTLLSDEYPKLWQDIKSIKDVTWVRLIRRNLFEGALSFIIAQQTQDWVHYKDMKMFDVDIDKFNNMLYIYIKLTCDLIDNNLRIPFKLTLFYEDGFKDKLSYEFNLDKNFPDPLVRAPSKDTVVNNYILLKEIALNIIESHERLNRTAILINGKITDANFIHTD